MKYMSAVLKLLGVLSYRTVRYTHRHQNDPALGMPYEVVFTMPQWKRVQATLKEIGIDIDAL